MDNMSLIRVTRGIPRFNIQIGPIQDAIKHNPSAILSVTDHLETNCIHLPNYMWIPINEVGKSWGMKPFFAVKRILDHYCLDLKVPLMSLCCTAGKHRSPMSAFCWLMSLPAAGFDSQSEDKFGGASPETVAKEFYGKFDDDPLTKYHQDLKLGYIPERLPEMYQLMRQYPSASYRDILFNMCITERISYPES